MPLASLTTTIAHTPFAMARAERNARACFDAAERSLVSPRAKASLIAAGRHWVREGIEAFHRGDMARRSLPRG